MRREEAIKLLVTAPAQVARWCGLDRLNDGLHGEWLREMIVGTEDMTLLAHRGSFKTTCLAFAMTAMLLLYPSRNIIFMRKTDEDVTEVLRQVKLLLKSDVLQYLSACIYGTPVQVLRSDMYSVHTACFTAPRGAVQLLGMGSVSAPTGKHADIVITDDIVTLRDRTSEAERKRIRLLYQELQNIRNPGGRIINTGTPWHPEDAISLMPNVQRYDWRRTGLLTKDEVRKLRASMLPSLFAANYELRHLAAEDALFTGQPVIHAEASLLRDGMAHVDAAYGGGDFTALTCGRIAEGHAYLYGRLWHKPIDQVMDEIITECSQLMCAPILCETNGDKGFVARALRQKGMPVRMYAESTNKHIKIGTWLRRWWPKVRFIEGTDRAYIDQILAYSPDAAHDDAPDSAACLLRALDREGL